MRLSRLAMLGALFLVCALPALGQGNATIVGTVTDAQGSVMTNVAITVTNDATGTVRTTATNEAGQYVLPNLVIGKYTVKATQKGFKAAEQKSLALNVGDRTRVDFQMQVGGATETITVEATALAVQTETGEQSSLINGKQVTELSTKNRTVYSYAALTTGAANLNPDTQLPVPTGGASSNISFNGNRPGHNLYMLDGGENSDRGGAGNSSVLPSLDAVAQTEVLSSNYSAEYGLSSGGTISSVTKSGTNKYHASAWEFFQNDALQGFNRFNTQKAEFRYNIFGFNVGGPVPGLKNKLFFFYNMEWRKIIQGTNINQQVPLPSTYGGAFPTGTDDPVITVPAASLVSASYLARNCPGGTLPAGVTQGQPFQNNIIPACMLDPNAQSLLTAGGPFGGIFPAPTVGDHFNTPVSAPNNLKEEITRIDYNATSKLALYGSFVAEQVAQNIARTMWSGDNVPSIGNTFGNPSYSGVFHTTYTISPTLINEASFNYNGNRIHILPSGLFTAPAGFTFAPFFPHTPGGNGENVDNRIPSISLGGSTGSNYTSNWMPWNNKADSYQMRDDVSWAKGRHQMKIGFGWLLYKKNQDWFKNTQGNFSFNGSFSGNDFSDYLLGLANNYGEDAVKEAGQWNNQSWSAYFQDNFRATKRLTLNLGLRWDGIPHTYEASNNMANFYPGLYDPALAAVITNGAIDGTLTPAGGLATSPDPALTGQYYVNGIAQCGVGGTPKGCVNDAWKNFGPRIGFAYDLAGDGKTVIRGGYGIMYERVQGNDVYNNAGTVPLAATISFGNVGLSDPTVNLLTGVANAGSIPINNVTGMDRNSYKSPLSSQFSLGVQRAFGKSVLDVKYVGTQNRHQNFYQEINGPAFGLLPTITNNNYDNNVAFPGYHGIRLARNEANGDYNSMQASLRGNVKSDLQYSVGYTYSHTNDAGTSGSSAGDLGMISNPYAGWKYDFGPADYDIRHVFFTNFVYDIPFMKNSSNKAAKMLIGGWEISGIIAAQSGAPLNIGVNEPNIAQIIPSYNQNLNRPNVSGSGHDPHTIAQWFDTSVFTAPDFGTWGNAARNSVRGPGRDNWSLSLFKNFWINQERGSNVQFRAEFFNVWNHTQLQGNAAQGGISRNLGAGDFGQVTGAFDPRTIQLALKVAF